MVTGPLENATPMPSRWNLGENEVSGEPTPRPSHESASAENESVASSRKKSVPF